ncbi:MAG: ribosome maturation factor RimP, partial [Clostridia bacterium]
ILDERDPVGCSYIFEVSSAGLERQLKRQSDFETYMGQQVVLRTFAPRDGTKEFSGTLKGYENGAVTLEINDVPTRFEKKEVAVVHLKIQI